MSWKKSVFETDQDSGVFDFCKSKSRIGLITFELRDEQFTLPVKDTTFRHDNLESGREILKLAKTTYLSSRLKVGDLVLSEHLSFYIRDIGPKALSAIIFKSPKSAEKFMKQIIEKSKKAVGEDLGPKRRMILDQFKKLGTRPEDYNLVGERVQDESLCELCQTPLKYKYRAQHRSDLSKNLWLGSTCIVEQTSLSGSESEVASVLCRIYEDQNIDKRSRFLQGFSEKEYSLAQKYLEMERTLDKNRRIRDKKRESSASQSSESNQKIERDLKKMGERQPNRVEKSKKQHSEFCRKHDGSDLSSFRMVLEKSVLCKNGAYLYIFSEKDPEGTPLKVTFFDKRVLQVGGVYIVSGQFKGEKLFKGKLSSIEISKHRVKKAS